MKTIADDWKNEEMQFSVKMKKLKSRHKEKGKYVRVQFNWLNLKILWIISKNAKLFFRGIIINKEIPGADGFYGKFKVRCHNRFQVTLFVISIWICLPLLTNYLIPRSAVEGIYWNIFIDLLNSIYSQWIFTWLKTKFNVDVQMNVMLTIRYKEDNVERTFCIHIT